MYVFLYKAKNNTLIKRFSRSSHANSKCLSNKNPELWPNVLEKDFINTLKTFTKKKNFFFFVFEYFEKVKKSVLKLHF